MQFPTRFFVITIKFVFPTITNLLSVNNSIIKMLKKQRFLAIISNRQEVVYESDYTSRDLYFEFDLLLHEAASTAEKKSFSQSAR